MNFLKDNKILVIWWIAATFVAILFFTPAKENPANIVKTVVLPFFKFSPEQRDELRDYFLYKFRHNGFNGVVLVGQKDSLFYSDVFGYANHRLKDTLNINSAFQLASVSKQFTAVAVLQLYEQGKLNITDTVQKFFSNFPYKGVTIHQLLCHRSGLPNYLYFFQHIPTTYDTVIYNQDVIKEMVDKHPRANYRPNRRYQYSNTGYAILAAIVEKVSKMPFNEYLKKFIFKPLAMDSTFTYADVLHNNRFRNTTGYLYRWRPAEDNYLDGVLGDKGIYTTAEDLFKWDQGLYKGVIINTDTLQLAFRPLGKPKRFKSNYGYGWRMYYYGTDSTKILYHAGWWHGYKSMLIRIPSDSTTVIVLKNRSRGASISSRRLLDILYKK